MADNRFSVILWCNNTNGLYFRACLESMVAMDNMDWELIILDENPGTALNDIAEEFFPGEGRIRYYRIRKDRGIGYAFNMGLHYSRGDYLVFCGQHDILSSGIFSEYERVINEQSPDIIYCDTVELSGNDRINPKFKPGYNKELLRHSNYIGDNITIKREALYKTGTFRESLYFAAVYDILLRATEKHLKIAHVPNLLYHIRVYEPVGKKQELKQYFEKIYKEHMTVLKAHLRREEIQAQIIPDRRLESWNIRYDGSDCRRYRREYVVVRERGCRVITRRAIEKLYGHIRQPDVGIVGVAVLKNYFTIDNCGYIFDKDGIAYPACHGHSVLFDGYMGRNILAQEVSMVDGCFCVIDKKVYKRLGGFNPNLIGRDRMLDFCLKVKRAGLRVIFEPQVKVIKRRGEVLSSKESNIILTNKWGEMIKKGDPYYNNNLPMGLENYFL